MEGRGSEDILTQSSHIRLISMAAYIFAALRIYAANREIRRELFTADL
jgi:hypothetical protein